MLPALPFPSAAPHWAATHGYLPCAVSSSRRPARGAARRGAQSFSPSVLQSLSPSCLEDAVLQRAVRLAQRPRLAACMHAHIPRHSSAQRSAATHIRYDTSTVYISHRSTTEQRKVPAAVLPAACPHVRAGCTGHTMPSMTWLTAAAGRSQAWCSHDAPPPLTPGNDSRTQAQTTCALRRP